MKQIDELAVASGSGAINDPKQLAAALRVGHQVMIQKQGTNARFRAVIVGWSDDRYVIAEIPRGQTISGHVAAGDELVLRYILRGVVYAFICRVMHVAFDPSLAVLAWPGGMSALPLTTERRLSVQIPATMEIDSEETGGVTLLATITDVSSGGCQVEAVTVGGPALNMDQGVRAKLRLSLAGNRREKTVETEIRNVMVSAGKVILGMSFVDNAGLDLRELAEEFFSAGGQ